MATNYRREIGRNGRHVFLLGSRIPQRMALTAQKSCLHRVKKLVNFGPLTPEITVIIWQPFMRQMRKIGETRSILGTRIQH